MVTHVPVNETADGVLGASLAARVAVTVAEASREQSTPIQSTPSTAIMLQRRAVFCFAFMAMLLFALDQPSPAKRASLPLTLLSNGAKCKNQIFVRDVLGHGTQNREIGF